MLKVNESEKNENENRNYLNFAKFTFSVAAIFFYAFV